MIFVPLVFLALMLVSPSAPCFPPPPVCPNNKQSCIMDNNDNVMQIKEVSNPLKCSKCQVTLCLSVCDICEFCNKSDTERDEQKFRLL